ncbi:toprim domain-containing protein [Moraxella sp. ZY210820]|uniref:toprim domain-containing protein n=1 Tax=unclassified Moraxella TaxID=2685852 RepID=UPI0027322B66|nr:toprim domain-containing protein [Moraxella sp. ZY210820]WLF84512.1 toprim domain-containing protein [Moraxella sp. ZY210820]
MNIKQKIDDRLNQMFNFKRVGEWYRQGICPQCGKKELFTHAENPRIVKCGRLNKCGYEEHVKDICQDLFKDWSKEFPRTKESPTATADAYLSHARGFDVIALRGLYSQELFRNDLKFPDQVSATVRFAIDSETYWERIIDRPERFGRQKANIVGKISGKYWTMHKAEQIKTADEIWIVEGIFDAIALNMALKNMGIIAVSCISSQNYPSDLLAQIDKKQQIVWAFDNDPAGKKAILKFHQRAIEEGFKSSAVLPNASNDWNDLFERDLLTDDDLKKYRHYGALHIAENANDTALLIFNYYQRQLKQFHFTHQYKTYWFKLDAKEYEDNLETQLQICDSTAEAEKQALQQTAKIEQICNATLKALYFQRDVLTDTAHYFFQIHSEQGTVQETFSPEQLTSKNNFTNRLLSVSAGAWWTGSEKQLQTIAQRETEHLKEVKTIDYMGYSKEHGTYVFACHAVHQGRIIDINEHDYYRAGKTDLKTLAKSPTITLTHETFKGDWWQDFYTINGEKGLILLAWWTGSYFAEQIRAKHSSFPFMEFVGQAGAGKSSLIEFLWKLSGRNDRKEGINPNSSSMVAVHRTMAQLSNLPVVFIEGDRKTEKAKQKFDWDELKDAFNGQNIRSRGVKTTGNETYEPPFRGAIMISQNDPIQASEAILSRTLHIFVDTKGHNYKNKLIANRLYSIEPDIACQYISHCLKNENKILETFWQKTAEIEKEYHDMGITHTRIALCHAQISAMIDAIAEHVLKDIIDLEEICDAKKLLEQMAQKRIHDLSADHIFVQQFFEVFEYLEANSAPAFKLNHYSEEIPYIAINLNEVYKQAHRHYQALPDINEMRDLLRSSRHYKFIEMNKQVKTANYPSEEGKQLETDVRSKRNVKCWIFQKPR